MMVYKETPTLPLKINRYKTSEKRRRVRGPEHICWGV